MSGRTEVASGTDWKKRVSGVRVVVLASAVVVVALGVRSARMRSWLRNDFEAALMERPAILGASQDVTAAARPSATAGPVSAPTSAATRGLPPNESADTVLELRLVTFNVWALPVALPGMARRSRLPRIPSAIAELSPTLVALQEAFDVDFRPFAVQYLGDAYQIGDGALCQKRTLGLLRTDCNGGLLTLSRFAVQSERAYSHEKHEGMKLDERFGSKGFLITTLSTALGPVHVINIHLYAGRNDADDEMRLRQLQRLEEVIEDERLHDRPIFLMGDLNSVHPGIARADERYAASEAYRFLTESLGFVETAYVLTDRDHTYDPETNGYADLWYNGVEGRQKLDYVLYRLPSGFQMRVLHHRVVLDDEPLLSDHYGFLVDLELRAAG